MVTSDRNDRRRPIKDQRRPEGTKLMVYNKLGYCRCGYEIWIEYLWTGKKWIQRFSDVNIQEITHCPDCGAVLQEDDLEC